MHQSNSNHQFVPLSKNLNPTEKTAAYEAVLKDLKALLYGEQDTILKMVSINCLLKTYMPHYYWVGFYQVKSEKMLQVGPYQGTMGCLYIPFGKGVCGAVAASQQTKIVKDVHLLAEGEDHITCDALSRSEIVVPVFDNTGQLIAVFDVDSTEVASFDEIDQQFLEAIMEEYFA